MASAAHIAIRHNDATSRKLLGQLKKLRGSVVVQQVLTDAGNELIRRMRPRIESGKNAFDRPMPDYSKKPAYFSKKAGRKTLLNKVANQGQAPDSGKKFKNGKQRRSVYFDDGYFGFRKVMGRTTNRNRLNMTGKMLGNMQTTTYGKTGVAIMFPRKSENAKALGNQEKYRFFGATRGERKALKQHLINEINHQMQKEI